MSDALLNFSVTLGLFAQAARETTTALLKPFGFRGFDMPTPPVVPVVPVVPAPTPIPKPKRRP